MIILALDPGPTESALVIYDSGKRAVVKAWTEDNDDLKARLCRTQAHLPLAIERVVWYGKGGNSLRDTTEVVGAFAELWRQRGGKVVLVTRAAVRGFLCAKNDAAVARRLRELLGEGMFYLDGVTVCALREHERSALAVALTAANGIQVDRKEKDNG